MNQKNENEKEVQEEKIPFQVILNPEFKEKLDWIKFFEKKTYKQLIRDWIEENYRYYYKKFNLHKVIGSK